MAKVCDLCDKRSSTPGVSLHRICFRLLNLDAPAGNVSSSQLQSCEYDLCDKCLSRVQQVYWATHTQLIKPAEGKK